MKFYIKTNTYKTEPQFVNSGVTNMSFKGFESNIKNLFIHLDNANGICTSEYIIDTSKSFDFDVSTVGYIWFEYKKTDKEYEIVLEVVN